MNANEIAFGIEFETTLPNSDTTPIGPYHGGYQVSWLPEGWKAERDGSIRTTLDRNFADRKASRRSSRPSTRSTPTGPRSTRPAGCTSPSNGTETPPPWRG